ncbi:MAG: phosphate-starvation-inducible PsiE family protein [Spirochaetes bacterium]|nr:phosphate-starvation-inducible PsiE family protein [Spirochaetota bacterium]
MKNCDAKSLFLKIISRIISIVSSILAVVMIGVIIFITVDLIRFIVKDILDYPSFSFSTSLIEIFGLFLNVLIAFEILENITSYIRKNHLQIELVVATSLTAVARKLIVFDFEKAGGIELIGLSVAIAALSGSYIFLRRSAKK